MACYSAMELQSASCMLCLQNYNSAQNQQNNVVPISEKDLAVFSQISLQNIYLIILNFIRHKMTLGHLHNPFQPNHIQTLSFEFIFRNLDFHQVNSSNIHLILSLALMHKFLKKYSIAINVFNAPLFFILCLLISEKVWNDQPHNNKAYSYILWGRWGDKQVLSLLNEYELWFLKMMEWDVTVSKDDIIETLQIITMLL